VTILRQFDVEPATSIEMICVKSSPQPDCQTSGSPRKILRIDNIPVLASGKLDIQACARLAAAGNETGSAQPKP